MKKDGFASIYLVYSLFLVFITMMLTVLMINNYKKVFMNSLKNDIKENLHVYKLEDIQINEAENLEENEI